MAQTLTEIKALLAEHGLRPKKRFGQNFLHDHNQLRRIIEAAAIRPGDLVLEVGAGTGTLSECLLDAGAALIAVEVDRDLEPILRQRLGDRAHLHIGNILAGKHEITPEVMELLGRRGGPPAEPGAEGAESNTTFKLVANLPYNIASPLLANLAVDHPNMTGAVVMVQREVADRLIAEPGGKDYGPLGIVVRAMCRVERIAELPPSCFWPQPEVASAVVKLARRDRPRTADPHRLSALVRKLFTKRRKQLGTILGRAAELPPGIDPAARPETLAVEQLEAIAGWLG